MRPLRRSIRKALRARERFFRRSLSQALGIGLIVTSGNALAQTAGQEDIPLTGIDVRAQRREYRLTEPSLFKFPDLLKDTPQSITVIPQELMREQAAFSMRDALRNVTGLSLNAGEGGVQGDNLTLRGYSARNDIYLDGVRDWGAYTRDVFNLEAVEVLKGPASTMFGRGSTGGVINEVSKTPTRTPIRDFSLTAGSGPMGRITFDVNQPLSADLAVRLNGMFHDANIVGRDHVEVQRWGLAPAVTLGLGGPTQLTLSYLYQHESNVPDNGLPYLFGEPAPVSRDTFYGLPDSDFERTDVHIGTLRLDHTYSDNLKFRNTLRYARYLRDQESTAPRISGAPTESTPLTDILVNRGIVARQRDDSILANQTDVIGRFDTWSVKHTLIAGVEADRETANLTSFTVGGVPQATLLTPYPFPDLSKVTKVKNQTTETTAVTASAYAVDEVAITKQWKIIGGLRYDHFHADFESQTAATGARVNLSRSDDVVSPRAALVFTPTTAQTYYFAWGNSFNPSAEALTLAANTVNTPPEKTQSYELGAKLQLLGEALSLNGAVFRIEKTDARTAEPGSPEQTLDGRQRAQGFEIEAVGRLLPGWNLFAGYTYLDTKVLESKDVQGGIPVEGKRLIAAPEHSFTLWTTWDITPQWQVGGGVTYVSERAANSNNTNVLPGYAKGDVTVAFYPRKGIELRLNVVNISDERYFDQVYQGHAPPAPGRTFLLSGYFRF
jgi:catecholate siderophore receptor